MKSILLICLLCLVTRSVHGKITLQWCPVSGAAGYRIYYGLDEASFDSGGEDFGIISMSTDDTTNLSMVDVATNCIYTISGLIPGQTNYFGIVAYDSTGAESLMSNILTNVAGGALTIQSQTNSTVLIEYSADFWRTTVVQASSDLIHWQDVFSIKVLVSGWFSFVDNTILAQRFYRLQIITQP